MSLEDIAKDIYSLLSYAIIPIIGITNVVRDKHKKVFIYQDPNIIPELLFYGTKDQIHYLKHTLKHTKMLFEVIDNIDNRTTYYTCEQEVYNKLVDAIDNKNRDNIIYIPLKK